MFVWTKRIKAINFSRTAHVCHLTSYIVRLIQTKNSFPHMSDIPFFLCLLFHVWMRSHRFHHTVHSDLLPLNRLFLYIVHVKYSVEMTLPYSLIFSSRRDCIAKLPRNFSIFIECRIFYFYFRCAHIPNASYTHTRPCMYNLYITLMWYRLHCSFMVFECKMHTQIYVQKHYK